MHIISLSQSGEVRIDEMEAGCLIVFNLNTTCRSVCQLPMWMSEKMAGKIQATNA